MSNSHTEEWTPTSSCEAERHTGAFPAEDGLRVAPQGKWASLLEKPAERSPTPRAEQAACKKQSDHETEVSPPDGMVPGGATGGGGGNRGGSEGGSSGGSGGGSEIAGGDKSHVRDGMGEEVSWEKKSRDGMGEEVSGPVPDSLAKMTPRARWQHASLVTKVSP